SKYYLGWGITVQRNLNKQLNALIQASMQNPFTSSDCNTTPFELVNVLRGLCLGDSGVGEEEVCDESPTSVMEGVVDVERVMLPKGAYMLECTMKAAVSNRQEKSSGEDIGKDFCFSWSEGLSMVVYMRVCLGGFSGFKAMECIHIFWKANRKKRKREKSPTAPCKYLTARIS
ncbi:hypothetical protein QQP08_026264, partial [Theobroma cacao]